MSKKPPKERGWKTILITEIFRRKKLLRCRFQMGYWCHLKSFLRETKLGLDMLIFHSRFFDMNLSSFQWIMFVYVPISCIVLLNWNVRTIKKKNYPDDWPGDTWLNIVRYVNSVLTSLNSINQWILLCIRIGLFCFVWLWSAGM